ncbi:PRD domain-containing protein [Enterococcus ratti]|uniref:BglG family transcription antiterminator n=1 Tax=Enterococcus ratti TaxID=150033 RepID=UPI0035148522
MYLSPREKQLMTELINSPTPVTIKRMMTLLEVSKRTVYRELENLENSLKAENASLRRVSRGSFTIAADEKVMEKLKKESNEINNELSTTKRQHAILVELLLTKKPLSLTHFLERYLISNTTFYADIKQIEESMAQLPLKIDRNRGYLITGPEKYRRLLVANVLELEINEYEIFYINDISQSSNYFFQFIDVPELSLAHKVIEEELNQAQIKLSDRKLEHLVLVLAITIYRVTTNDVLTNEVYTGLVNKELLVIAKRIFLKIGKETKKLYPINEIVFFASLLNDFSHSFDQRFFEETFDTNLAYLVKQLIQEVSEKTKIPFYEDETLYKMLLTHLSGVFSRAILQEKNLTNPILEKIIIQYEEIAEALQVATKRIFREKKLSEEEIAYMVLHFANSLEKNPKKSRIRVAVFSPSGLASTSMLEMRLKHYFPFLDEIHFYRIAELKSLTIEKEYDLILSTSVLPGYKGKYVLVSPLLLKDEVQQLRREFTQLEKKKRMSKDEPPATKNLLKDTYEQTIHTFNRIQQLLNSFFIQTIKNPVFISEILKQLFTYFPDEWIKNEKEVYQGLLNRYKQSPVGIPKTNMGLFHTSSTEVAEPIFCIFDLKHPIKIESMDKKEILLTRMLIMLAPSPIEEETGKLLGKISSAIIMNDLNIEIFRSGNREIIYQLLSKILIEEVQKERSE